MDTETAPLPIKIKKLSEAEWKVGNALVGSNDVAFDFELGQKIDLRLQLCPHVDYHPKLHILFSADNLKFWVSFETLDALACVAPEFSMLPFETLSADVLPVVVASLLVPLLQKIEIKTHQKFHVEQVTTTPVLHIPDTLHLSFIIGLQQGTSVRGECRFDATAATFLTQNAPKRTTPSQRIFSQLTFPFQAYLGYTALDYETYSQLALNDVILIENATLLANECVQFSNASLKFIAKTEEDFKVTVMEPMSTQPPKQAPVRPSPAAAPKSATPPTNEMLTDTLEVQLAFTVGEKHLTLAELRAIKPGYSFEFDASIDAPIAVYANGHAIGKGELVQINERVGVRLTEFNDDAVR